MKVISAIMAKVEQYGFTMGSMWVRDEKLVFTEYGPNDNPRAQNPCFIEQQLCQFA